MLSRFQYRIESLAATLFLAVFITTLAAQAHEIRPAYFEIKESAAHQFDLIWRTPVTEGVRLPVALQLPDGCTNVVEPIVIFAWDSRIEQRRIEAGPNGLADQRIIFSGLDKTSSDVLVRVALLDGRSWTTIVRPSQPWVTISAAPGWFELAGTYIVEGIRHILFGVDHLLFILGLLLIVKDWWTLLKTVTAFTVAHSITLAIATLGYANAPAVPLNAAIALSILFLGPEIIRVWRGQTSFTIRHPWIVAFVFGLIHGFGFASALTSAGLPHSDLPLALLSFNIGVELGQVAFIVLVMSLERSFRQLEIHWPRWVELMPGYTVGTLGAFWTIQRTCVLLGVIQ